MRYKPYPYQEGALAKALKINRGFAVLFDPGLGKTKVVMDFCNLKFREGLRKVLVGTTLSGIGVWKNEAKKHLDRDIPFRVIRLDVDDKKEVIEEFKKNPKKLTIVVGTYPTITRYRNELMKWIDKKSFVVADELHYLGSFSQRQRAFRTLGKRAQWRMGLTGTATVGIKKKPTKIFYMYKFLDDSVFGTNKKDFEAEYTIMGGFMGKKVKALKNPTRLSKKIRSISYVATESDTPRANQKRTSSIIPVYLSPKSQRLYNQMADNAVIKVNNQIITAEMKGTLALKLQQMCGGFVFYNEEDEKKPKLIPLNNDKLKVLMSLVDKYHEYDEKIVIFARFRPELDLIDKELTRKKYKHFVIRGGVPGKERDRSIELFNKPGFSIMCCQIGAGSEAIDLTAARIAIYYSLDFKPENFIQSLKRIDRNGQIRSMVFHFLLCEGTVDYGILESLSSQVEVGEVLLHRFDELIRGKPLRLKEIDLFKKGGNKMARVNGSKKAQGLVDGKDSLGGITREQDKALDKMLEELEKELKEGGKTPEPAKADGGKGGKRIVTIPMGEAQESGGKKAQGTDKKPRTTEKQPPTGETVTLKELASELKTEPAKLRKWLRGRFGQTDGRWEWAVTDPNLKAIREGFGKKGK